MLTQAELKAVLRYEPETGDFYWIKSLRHGFAGKLAGCKYKSKNSNTYYIGIRIYGTRYLAHRLAWLYVHGCWPESLLDHKNGNGADNSILNLRVCTDSQNHMNARKRKNTISGFKNVFLAKTGRWGYLFTSYRRRISKEGFASPEEAAIAAAAKRLELHGEFANHG